MHLHVGACIDQDMRPNSKEVAYGSVADSHDEPSKHDRVLPTGLVRNTVTSHWNKESQECNYDGQHESDWLNDVARYQYGNEHGDRCRVMREAMRSNNNYLIV